MNDTMAPPTAESNAERGNTQGPEHQGDLGDRLRVGVLDVISRWAEGHLGGNPEVAKAKLDAYERVHSAMRVGWRKSLHEKARPLAELDATISQWMANRKADIFGVLKTVAGPEVPLILCVPSAIPGHIDAATARVGGWLGEKAVQFDNWRSDMMSDALDAGRRGVDAVYHGIISAFHPAEATPISQPLPAGGAA